MGFFKKACLAVTLGAAYGLKDQAMKSNASAFKLNYFAALGSSSSSSSPPSSHVLFGHGSQGSMEKPYDGAPPLKTKEEPLRMVVYLSCWGPN